MGAVVATPVAIASPGSAEQRFVLWDVGWDVYEMMLREIGDRPIRLTYDGANLELMSPSRWHEIVKSLLGRFVEALTLELDIPLASGGAMTFKRKDLLRGLEPDECYWIASESKVRGKRELNFRKDPPPDLAIEVDMSRSARPPRNLRQVESAGVVALRRADLRRTDSATGRRIRTFRNKPFVPVSTRSRANPLSAA